MNIQEQIQKDLNSLFIYANSQNTSSFIKKWKELDLKNRVLIDRVQLVYQKCVSCNILRFNDEQLKRPTSKIKKGENTYFCNECLRLVEALGEKYIGFPETFEKVLGDFLFGRNTSEVVLAKL